MDFGPAFLAAGDAAAAGRFLNCILRRPDPLCFASSLRRLDARFASLVNHCPAPYLAPGLVITPETRFQSELYLPVDEISALFTRLYSSALTYPPLLSSAPFYDALSWADLFVALPPRFQLHANPARLLGALLTDHALLTEFLFLSFLPRRFYGRIQRYPLQQEFVRTRLNGKRHLRCLDAACGTGEATWGLAGFLREQGTAADDLELEGWTIEPLEVWAAASRSYPPDRQRESRFREATEELLQSGFCRNIRFRCADLLDASCWQPEQRFDLVLCNGLLGGPIIHRPDHLRRAVENLVSLLAPGGLLLAADSFHGGWKKQVPEEIIGELFRECGLQVMEAGEGIGGVRAAG